MQGTLGIILPLVPVAVVAFGALWRTRKNRRRGLVVNAIPSSPQPPSTLPPPSAADGELRGVADATLEKLPSETPPQSPAWKAPAATLLEFSPPKKRKPLKKGAKSSKKGFKRPAASTDDVASAPVVASVAPAATVTGPTAAGAVPADDEDDDAVDEQSEEDEQPAAPASGALVPRKVARASLVDRPPIRGVPEGLVLMEVRPDLVAERKFLDMRRYFCISRPQYKYSCGLSSLTAVWNFLYSTLGTGNLPPITQEQLMLSLGFAPPFADIRFGPFTGNETLLRWFRKFNMMKGLKGWCGYLWKPKGKCQTPGVSADEALAKLMEGLRSGDTAFIYHCWNHYMCPIGFDVTPRSCPHAYNMWEGDCDTTIFIGDSSRTAPPIHAAKWADVVKDLMCEGPAAFNIRHPEKGIVEHGHKKGSNLHCIMFFRRNAHLGAAPASASSSAAPASADRAGTANCALAGATVPKAAPGPGRQRPTPEEAAIAAADSTEPNA